MSKDLGLYVKLNTVAMVNFDFDDIIEAINCERNRAQRWNIVAKIINQIEFDGIFTNEQRDLIVKFLETKLENFKKL